MAGLWGRTRSLLERFRDNETDWVEPGNWVTRAISDGSLERPAPTQATPAYELAPDNVIIAASKPYTPPAEEPAAQPEIVEEPAAETAVEVPGRTVEAGGEDRVARAG